MQENVGVCMEKITTLKDLISLKNQIRTANASVKLKADYSFWDGGKERRRKDELQLAANNQAYEVLPESIEISPDLALFMGQNIDGFKKDEAELLQNQSPLTRIALTTITYIEVMTFPSFHSVLNAIGSTKRTIQLLGKYDQQIKALQESQDVISIAVLSAYNLQQAESGKFVLTRGSWIKTEHSEFNGRGTTISVAMRPANTSLDCVARPEYAGRSDYNHYAMCACGYNGLEEPVQKPKTERGK
jgi:hypothetical protein